MFDAPKAFIISLFHLFITTLVMVNFLGWSGGAPSLTGYEVGFWENSYFGFESLTMLVTDFGNFVDSFGKYGQMSYLLETMTQVTNDILFGIPSVITSLANGSGDILTFIKFIFTLLLQPLLLTIHILGVLAFIGIYILAFVKTFFQFCGGKYNVPFESTSDVWSQWSYLESEFSWQTINQSIRIIGETSIVC